MYFMSCSSIYRNFKEDLQVDPPDRTYQPYTNPKFRPETDP